MKAALYCRVSTDEQTVENQIQVLTEVAKHRGWDLTEVYSDEGISGAKTSRPAFDRLLEDASRHKFNMVMFWALDRVGRSVRGITSFAEKMDHYRIDMYCHNQNLDTSSPGGKLLFHMLSAIAEFERDLIVERTKAGMARAKKEGKRIGRPKIPVAKVAQIEQYRRQGMGIQKIAKQVGVGVGTVQRVVGC